RIHEPRKALDGERQAPMIENSPVGVGVDGAPITTLTRRATRPLRKTVSVRLASETAMLHALGRNSTCSARIQPLASLGRVESLTLTQQRPSCALVAPSTSSHGACPGVTEPPGCALLRGVPYTLVEWSTPARPPILLLG